LPPCWRFDISLYDKFLTLLPRPYAGLVEASEGEAQLAEEERQDGSKQDLEEEHRAMYRAAADFPVLLFWVKARFLQHSMTKEQLVVTAATQLTSHRGACRK